MSGDTHAVVWRCPVCPSWRVEIAHVLLRRYRTLRMNDWEYTVENCIELHEQANHGIFPR